MLLYLCQDFHLFFLKELGMYVLGKRTCEEVQARDAIFEDIKNAESILLDVISSSLFLKE